MEEAQATGISKDVSDIVIPMGATMHMDGSAMSAIIKVAFLFGIFGMDFSTGRALLAILVAVFSSVAMSLSLIHIYAPSTPGIDSTRIFVSQ